MYDICIYDKYCTKPLHVPHPWLNLTKNRWNINNFYSILFYSILFYSILLF